MRIWISIRSQTLDLYGDDDSLLRRYSVSTAGKGAGEINGSFQTPRGRHIIRAKIGAGAPDNTVFVRRRPTGEIWSPELAAAFPGRDWILTRILWLSGCQPGFNRLGNCDTMRRYVYLHGSPDNVAMGQPGSIGCIRMRNRDIVELFDLIPAYTPVDIVEYALEQGDWTQLGLSARLVRDEVFVREQGVPVELEHDDADVLARHVLACGPDGEPIGTGRLLLAVGEPGHASAQSLTKSTSKHVLRARIGRMAVLPAWRGRGVGRELLLRLLMQAKGQAVAEVFLHAQIGAVDFYRRMGFEPEGPEFIEAGIVHMPMVKSLA